MLAQTTPDDELLLVQLSKLQGRCKSFGHKTTANESADSTAGDYSLCESLAKRQRSSCYCESHQVSLIIFHPRSTNKVVLFPPPVTKSPEEVVGEEPIDGVPDYVNVNRLFYPEPNKDR